MKCTTALLIILTLIITPTLSIAQTKQGHKAGEATGKTQERDGIVYEKETVMDFDPLSLEAGAVKPNWLDVTGEQRGKTSSLVKVRMNFIPELVKSLDDI